MEGREETYFRHQGLYQEQEEEEEELGQGQIEWVDSGLGLGLGSGSGLGSGLGLGSGCRHHAAAVQLPTQDHGPVCLACLSSLLSDSLLSHKAFALSWLAQALQDPVFVPALLSHPCFISRLLAPPLVLHALPLCAHHDPGLAVSVQDTILALCRLAPPDHEEGMILIETIITHIVMHLSSQMVIWGKGQLYALHILGLLLDAHCKESGGILPSIMKSESNFLINIVCGLKLPGDELKGEILFVLYKYSLLEDGIVALQIFLADIIPSSVSALLRTESDELRMNCIALLSALAQRRLVDLCFLDEGELCHSDDLLRMFAEAIKGCLMSSDTETQVTTLKLICYLCPNGAMFERQIGILIEEGVMDYIFELLKTSAENVDSFLIWSVNVFTLLSEGGGSTFTQCFIIGFDTATYVLQHSLETGCFQVLPEILQLIIPCLSDCPGAISSTLAQPLILSLIDILKILAKDCSLLLPNTYIFACGAFSHFLKLPCALSIPDGTRMIAAVVTSAINAASLHDQAYTLKHKWFFHATTLLKEAFAFSLGVVEGHPNNPIDLMDVLTETWKAQWMEAFMSLRENLEDDESTIIVVLDALNFLLEAPLPSACTHRLAEEIASSSWFSLCFEWMSLYPIQSVIKEASLRLCRALIMSLDGNSVEKEVEMFLLQLPGDPHDLLILLSQKSIQDHNLMLVQFAIFAIFYVSKLYGDRLAEDEDIFAAVEQYLLMNVSNLYLGPNFSCVIRHLLYVYVLTREAFNGPAITCSDEAENNLLSLLVGCDWEIVFFKAPKTILHWLLIKDNPNAYVMAALLTCLKMMWKKITPQANSVPMNEITLDNPLKFFIDLIEESNNAFKVISSLLNEALETQIEENIKVVGHMLIFLVRISNDTANKSNEFGLIHSIRKWSPISGTDLPATSHVVNELVIQILLSLDSVPDLASQGSWAVIVNQSIHTLLMHYLDENYEANTLQHFYILSLIVHKSLIVNGMLREASEAVLLNIKLYNLLESTFTRAALEGSKLSHYQTEAFQTQLLRSSLLLWLLCTRSVINQKANMQCKSLQNDITHTLRQRLYTLVEPLCRITYFSLCSVKAIALSCLVEVFQELAGGGIEESEACKEEMISLLPDTLQSIVMVLQSCVFDSNYLVGKNSGLCLYWLISSNCKFNLNQQRAIEKSCWHHFLMEEFAISISDPDESSYVNGCASHIMCIAVALLRLSSPPHWISLIFNPARISAIITNLTSEITLEMLPLFQELLRACFLDANLKHKLLEKLQAARKALYKETSALHLSSNNIQRSNMMPRVVCYEDFMNAVICCHKDPFTQLHSSLSEEPQPARLLALRTNLDLLVSECSALS